jgi:hypothetical protein
VNHDGFVDLSSNLISNLETPIKMLSPSAIQGAHCFLLVKAVATTDDGRQVTNLDHDQGPPTSNCWPRQNNSSLPEPARHQMCALAICEVSAKAPSMDSLSSSNSPSTHRLSGLTKKA